MSDSSIGLSHQRERVVNAASRFRVVLVSPGDVGRERAGAQTVVDEINRRVTSHPLSLWHWDTDAHANLHLVGPHGRIDERADIQAADLVIGVFWKRLGASSRSAIVSELRRAIAVRQERGTPEVIVAICTRAYSPATLDELAQRASVLELVRQIPGGQVRWEYESILDLEGMLREHLTRFVRERTPTALVAESVREERPKPISACVSSDSVREEWGGPASARVSAESVRDAPALRSGTVSSSSMRSYSEPYFEYYEITPVGRLVAVVFWLLLAAVVVGVVVWLF